MLFKRLNQQNLLNTHRFLSNKNLQELEILGNKYKRDEWTNVSNSILSKLGRNLTQRKYHPLSHLTNQIKNHFYKSYVNRFGNPIFSIYENLNPIVTVEQNFDSLMVPKDHASRSKSDCYYLNKDYLLRAHTSAHQYELIKSGLNSFLVIGDVYRRDEIDAKHYPVFHQCEGVCLFNKYDLFKNEEHQIQLNLFENDSLKQANNRLELKQEWHTLEAVKLIEYNLKKCLLNLVKALFGTS
jgi:phenylalanyl-tRNA synthetase alpha chain